MIKRKKGALFFTHVASKGASKFTNREETQKSMNSMENMLSRRIPKKDMEIPKSHENNDRNCVETQSCVRIILS